MKEDTFKKAQDIYWEKKDVDAVIAAIEAGKEVTVNKQIKHEHITMELDISSAPDTDSLLQQLKTKSAQLQKQFDEV